MPPIDVIPFATFAVSLGILWFSNAPFSVLIYFMGSQTVMTWDAWIVNTSLMLVAQWVYGIRKELE